MTVDVNFLGKVNSALFVFKIVETCKDTRADNIKIEPTHEKTNSSSFRPGPIQTRLYRQRKYMQLEACNFRFRKKRHHTIYGAKTKALISCAVTAQLICDFGFAYVYCCFF